MHKIKNSVLISDVIGLCYKRVSFPILIRQHGKGEAVDISFRKILFFSLYFFHIIPNEISHGSLIENTLCKIRLGGYQIRGME